MSAQESQKPLAISTIVNQCLPRFQEISNTNGNAVKWQQESQFAIQALQKNKKLTECALHTIENAIINVAACGLSLNPADGYAYLVPEYDKSLGGQACQLRISFKGLIKAATDSGVIKFVRAEIVKKNDTFTYTGAFSAPIHEMNPFSERGEPIGVYCIAKTNDGEVLTDVMNWDEVLKIKAAAKTQDVWNQWLEEMAKKAIVKRAAKMWPKSKESTMLNHTVSVLNEVEGGDPMENLGEIAQDILDSLERDDIFGFGEIWDSLTERQIEILWTAKTKGGWFSQEDKTQIRAWIVQWKKMQNQTIDVKPETVE
jgi:recombination protein RecT